METVLFVCYNNAGRSQMAEAFFNAGAVERGLDVHAESAGLLSAGVVHPQIVRCIEELGISAEGLRPKAITKEMVERASSIVAFGKVNSEHTSVKFTVTDEWTTADPAGMAYGSLCELRNEISHHVDEFLDRLQLSTNATADPILE